MRQAPMPAMTRATTQRASPNVAMLPPADSAAAPSMATNIASTTRRAVAICEFLERVEPTLVAIAVAPRRGGQPDTGGDASDDTNDDEAD